MTTGRKLAALLVALGLVAVSVLVAAASAQTKTTTITIESWRSDDASIWNSNNRWLTIHGTTKEVVLDVDGPSQETSAMNGIRMGAEATTKINRKDFGVNGAPGVVGDDINITIDVELIQPQAK